METQKTIDSNESVSGELQIVTTDLSSLANINSGEIPENLEENKGITKDDLRKIGNGGSLTLELLVSDPESELEDTEQEQFYNYENIVRERMEYPPLDTSEHGLKIFSLDISIRKTLKDSNGTTEQPINLTELNNLVEIYVSLPNELSNDKGSMKLHNPNLRIFRVHDGALEELPKSPNKNRYGEYFEIIDKNRVAKLVLNRFSYFFFAAPLGDEIIEETIAPDTNNDYTIISSTPTEIDDDLSETDINDNSSEAEPDDLSETEPDDETIQAPDDLTRIISSKEAKQIRKSIKTSKFNKLRFRATKNTKNKITLKWGKQSNATGYMIYGSKCNEKHNKHRITYIKTVSADTLKTVIDSLEESTYHKFVIVAYKLVDGKRVAIAKSPVIHTATGNKYGKETAVLIEKIGNRKINSANQVELKTNVSKEKSIKLTMKKGKKLQILAKVIHTDKPYKNHRGLVYESINSSVVRVTKNGIIKAVGKGICKVLIYAQNGTYNVINVVVE